MDASSSRGGAHRYHKAPTSLFWVTTQGYTVMILQQITLLSSLSKCPPLARKYLASRIFCTRWCQTATTFPYARTVLAQKIHSLFFNGGNNSTKRDMRCSALWPLQRHMLRFSHNF
ncbi:hypothetical protein E2C01_000220 [Portunus trituberculatus]|uniref:Uncharacterized protein n=1 Tax=Portunus trituberculatus TaxID=210409 RepID=A0A5B7CGQ0_PORTR|nr:hypothetical protein [Portunus trituberculatus]